MESGTVGPDTVGALRRGVDDSSAESPAASIRLFAACLGVTGLAVVTGSVDVTLPRFLHLTPFPIASAVVAGSGAVGLFLYILVHNWGIALVVPTLGVLFASREADPKLQRRIIDLMAVSTALALVWGTLAVGLQWTSEVALLFGLEAFGVLLVSFGGRRVLARLIAAGGLRGRHGVARAFRALGPYVAGGYVVLAAGAFVEVLFILADVTLPF